MTAGLALRHRRPLGPTPAAALRDRGVAVHEEQVTPVLLDDLDAGRH